MAEHEQAYRNSWSDIDVARHWDRVASIYVDANKDVEDTHVQRFKEAVKHLDLVPGCRVLNVSSRDCEADDYICRACPGADVLNAEISGGLIEVAAQIRPHVTQCKIETYSELPFKDREFERVLSLETLEHVAEPLRFLRELHRVSTHDAVLVLSAPPATSELPYRIYTCLFGGHGEGPHRFLASGEVKDMFKKTGWRLELHQGTLLVPVGPRYLKDWGERIIARYQHTFISELGIRQFYVCRKSSRP